MLQNKRFQTTLYKKIWVIWCISMFRAVSFCSKVAVIIALCFPFELHSFKDCRKLQATDSIKINRPGYNIRIRGQICHLVRLNKARSVYSLNTFFGTKAKLLKRIQNLNQSHWNFLNIFLPKSHKSMSWATKAVTEMDVFCFKSAAIIVVYQIFYLID